jgi:predicted RNA polymerase sigma factor
VVALNRAIVVLEHRARRLPSTPSTGSTCSLTHLFHATWAEALGRAGCHDEAADALRRAIALTSNTTERRHLERELAGVWRGRS